MEPIKVARSFLDADALAAVVAREYDIGQPSSSKMFSKLLRTQDNDHYRIIIDGNRYVLRVYQQGDSLGRSEADYLFELEWLLYLKEQGIPVSFPLRRQDGRLLGSIAAPEGQRHFALFTFARGQSMSTSDADQLYTFGRYMARIHNVSQDFRSAHKRMPIDMTCLFEQPIDRIKHAWGPRRADNLDILLTSAEEARQEVYTLLGDPADGEGGVWGVIGGDFHNLSVHFSNDTPTFFNFDRCGYGWRAYDIAAFLSNTNLLQVAEGYSEAFFAGYYAERPLLREEHLAISPFLTLRRVWRMGLFALNEGLAGYTFLAPA